MWGFDWSLIDVLVGGKSSLDLPELKLRSESEIDNFLRNYGFDPDRKEDQRRIHAMIVEALSFLEKFLLVEEWAEGLKPPPEVIMCDDARQLLAWCMSSAHADIDRRLWSCAVLRIMHIIAYISETQKPYHVKMASKQICERFNARIYTAADGTKWIGEGGDRIQLERVEWKYTKSRESLILKLLQKPANMTENIYDMVGIRLVTKRLCDVMLVVKYLHEFNLVTYVNSNPARAQNTLIDVEYFKSQIETLRDMLIAGNIPPDRFEAMVTKMTCPSVRNPKSTKENPHSSITYRSVQLTCRQLIRYRNPVFTWHEKLFDMAHSRALNAREKETVRAFRGVLDRWASLDDQPEVAVFFPYEIQVMDIATYIHNQFGGAAHDRYKRAQIRTIRKRILTDILKRAGKSVY